jgi:hypothetical protein
VLPVSSSLSALCDSGLPAGITSAGAVLSGCFLRCVHRDDAAPRTPHEVHQHQNGLLRFRVNTYQRFKPLTHTSASNPIFYGFSRAGRVFLLLARPHHRIRIQLWSFRQFQLGPRNSE